MSEKFFEGWYFKHQAGECVISLIPGRTGEGAFVLLIWPGGSKVFRFPELRLEDDTIRVGACRFSPRGCSIDLPGVRGELHYGPLSPLTWDIMGPFRHLPLECRHFVISMAHSLRGSLTIDGGTYPFDGGTYPFDGGTGYIEGDRGRSFPRSYRWLQCGGRGWSLMAATAEIPILGLRFPGCICAIQLEGREYRLATYRGVRVRESTPSRLCLTQGKLRLEVDITQKDGHPLPAPARGKMSRTIRETLNAPIHARLWEGEKLLLDQTALGVCEYVM